MPSPPPTPQATPIRSPKRRMQTPPAPHTPRTRADILREKMAITPPKSRFARYVSSGADGLDALAAVASTAPPSPAVGGRIMLHTPISAANAAVRWLCRMAESRPEISKGWGKDAHGSEALREVISDKDKWQHIVDLVRQMSDRLDNALPGETDKERMEQAVAVFFASLEHVLEKEATRLKGKPKWIIDNLVKATAVHKSLFLCSYEVMVAAYGKKDCTVFVKAIEILDVPPLDIVKAVESFIRLPEMPRPLVTHIITCGNRVLESMAWKVGSKLVLDLKERAMEKTLEAKQPTSPTQSKENQPNGTAKPEDQDEACKESEEEDVPKNAVREFALEFIYKKMLSIASERAQELLIRLGMDAIAEYVWASIKYAVWERWHLMVDRHLDQVIMCCVYGVAKVRRYDLKFREIIQAYQTMSHVREPSFSHLVPGVFRDVSLDSHINLMPSDDGVRNIRHDGKGVRGDIIKLYNQVFIHSMKTYILQFQINSSVPPSGVMSVRNLVGNSSADSHAHSSTGFPLSASNSILSGTPVGNEGVKGKRDSLNEKVMSSPMRMLRPHASPRRIGRVTVSPMSPGGRSLVAIRQSPGRRAAGNIIGGMTPGTRKLYAFGESPVKSLDRINRSLAETDGEGESRRTMVRNSIPLSFEGNGIGQRKASMRRRVADALPFKTLRNHLGSVRFASTSDGADSTSGTDMMAKAKVESQHSGRLDEGSTQTGTYVQSSAT